MADIDKALPNDKRPDDEVADEERLAFLRRMKKDQ